MANNSQPRGNNSVFDTDLQLADYYLDAKYLVGADLTISKSGDLAITSDDFSIGQAILHRIRTIKGELAEIGHPDYGSNIADFVGLPNDQITRARIRLSIRDTLRSEQRIKEIVNISVKPRPHSTSIPSYRLERTVTKKDEDLSLGNYESKGPEGKPRITTEKAPITQMTSTDDSFSTSVVNSTTSLTTEMQNSVDIEIIIVLNGQSTPLQLAFPLNLEVS